MPNSALRVRVQPCCYVVVVDPTIVVAIIAALGLVIANIVQSALSRAAAKSDLEQDIELLKMLPAESKSKTDLLADIDRRVLLRFEKQQHSRYWFGIVLSLVLGGAGFWFGYYFVITSEWWRWVFLAIALFLVVFGISGLAVYAPKRERGTNGIEIKRASNDKSQGSE